MNKYTEEELEKISKLVAHIGQLLGTAKIETKYLLPTMTILASHLAVESNMSEADAVRAFRMCFKDSRKNRHLNQNPPVVE